MAPSMPTASLMAALLLSARGIAATPSHDYDCQNHPKEWANCLFWSPSWSYSAVHKCQDYVIGDACSGQIWQLCPQSCGFCVDAAMSPPECLTSGGDGTTYHYDSGAVVTVYTTVYIVVMSLLALGCVGRVVAYARAHVLRQRVLAAARRGEAVSPPENCLLLWCCGPQAIYYWEGCSANFAIALLLLPYYALCCWSKTRVPLENGAPVVALPPPAPPVVLASVCTPPGGDAKAVTVATPPVVLAQAVPQSTKGEEAV